MTRVRRPFSAVGAFLAIALTCASFLVPTATAHAASNGEWAVQPYFSGTQQIPRDWFEYTLKPGQSLRDIVAISNLSKTDKLFAVYATDAYETPLDAGFALLLQKDKPKDAGKWIRLGIKTIRIPSHKLAAVPFALSVPSNASPGDHAAGIVVQDITPSSSLKKGKGVEIERRVGARVYIRVAGPVDPAIDVQKITIKTHHQGLTPGSHGTADIGYVVKNVGNVRIAPTAQLTIKGLFGRTLKRFSARQVPELLPGATFVITEQWKGTPYLDRVQAQVHVSAFNGQYQTTRSKTVWVGPWLWILLVILVLVVAFVTWRIIRRRKAKPTPAAPTEPQPEPVPV
jgi:hypothetical protein